MSNPVFEAVRTVLAVREYQDKPIPDDVLDRIVEAGHLSASASNVQPWHFVVVTDAQQRKALGEIYSKGFKIYREQGAAESLRRASSRLTREQLETLKKVQSSSDYLAEHMREVPVLVIPCLWGRVDTLPVVDQAGTWGSILPAVWSFMLAARARGLGTCWTTIHLYYEQEAAQVLGIPFDKVTQAALIPVAHTLGGTDFKPAPRVPLDSILHWDKW